jgi:hypothetical protein
MSRNVTCLVNKMSLANRKCECKVMNMCVCVCVYIYISVLIYSVNGFCVTPGL